MTTITSTTYTLGGKTTITQKRRITEHGRYVYQKREILTRGQWVRTLPWVTRFVNEIGRAR